MPHPAPVAAGSHRYRVMGDMGVFADEVLAEIARARSRVDVECFIVRDDRLGQALGAAMAAAAARGVRTRLLYDPLGCRKTSKAYFEALGRQQVEVRKYGNLGALLIGQPGARNHARIVVVDDRAYTGGHAWGDEWLPVERGGGGWHDVCACVEGPLVADFMQVFDEHWMQAARERPLDDHDSGNRFRDVRLVCDAPVRESVVLGAHLDAFERARRRIWMANAYFYPPRVMRQALRRAHLRGVDVKVIVPSISDLALMQAGTRGSYQHWQRAGLEVWEYQGVVMHSKYAVVDDDWCLVGTFNANPVSIAVAIEIAALASGPLAAGGIAQMERDLAASRCVAPVRTTATPNTRPAPRALWRRILDRGARWLLVIADLILRKKPSSGTWPD
jgi:cardiolipin synthase A/B